MEFLLQSYVHIGDIVFGMKREQIRDLLKEKVSEFKRNSFSETSSDFFENIGVIVCYDTLDECEAVEFAGPAKPIIMGCSFLGEPYDCIKKKILESDKDIEEDETGFISFKLGFGVYLSSLEDAKAPIESVTVFRKGYYD